MAGNLRCTALWLYAFLAVAVLSSIVAGDGPFHDPPPKSSQDVVTFVSLVPGPSGTSLIEIPIAQPTPDSSWSSVTTTYEVTVMTDGTALETLTFTATELSPKPFTHLSSEPVFTVVHTSLTTPTTTIDIVIPTQQTSPTSTPITVSHAQNTSPTSLGSAIITTQVSPSSSPSSISTMQQISPTLTNDGITTTTDPVATANTNTVITSSRNPVTTTAEDSNTVAKVTTQDSPGPTSPSSAGESSSGGSNPIPGGPPGTGGNLPVAPIAPIVPLIPPIVPDGPSITVDSSGSSGGAGNGSNKESTATDNNTKTSTSATSKTSRTSKSTKTRTTFTLSFIPPPTSSSSISTLSSSIPLFSSFWPSFGPGFGSSSTILSLSSAGPSRSLGISTTLFRPSTLASVKSRTRSPLGAGPSSRSTQSNAHPVITGRPHSGPGIVLSGPISNSAESHSASGDQTHKTTPAIRTDSTGTPPAPESQHSDGAHHSSPPESLSSAPARQSQPQSSRQVWSAPAPSSTAAPASSAPPSSPSGAASAPAAAYSGGVDKRMNHGTYKAKKKDLPITTTFSTRFVAREPRTSGVVAAPKPVMTVGRYEHVVYDVCVVRGRGCRL